MARVKKFGQTVLATRASIRREKRMVKALSTGLMARPTPVTSSTTTSTVMACTLGVMAASIPESGLTTKCMAMACSPGRMAEDTLVTMSTIRRKETEFLPGLMVASTKASGKMESSTALEPITPAKMKSKRGSGLMASGYRTQNE